MFQDIVEEAEVPEVVTTITRTLHDVPKPLLDDPKLDSAGTIFHEQKAHGNRTRKLRRVTGLRLKNPYQIIRRELLEKGIIDSTDIDEFGKRVKSTLATEFVLPDNNIGCDDLGRTGTLLSLERKLCVRRFWQDTGTPANWT